MAVVSIFAVLPATLGAASADPGHCAVVDSSGFCLVAAVDPARPGGPADPARKPRHPVRPTVPTPGPTPLTSVDLSAGLAGKFIDKFGRPVPGTADVLALQAIRLLRLPPPAIQLSVQDRAYVGEIGRASCRERV